MVQRIKLRDKALNWYERKLDDDWKGHHLWHWNAFGGCHANDAEDASEKGVVIVLRALYRFSVTVNGGARSSKGGPLV